MLGLNLLDGVPADDQMVGDILDGHEPREIAGIAFEGAGVMFLGIGKGDLDLANLAAGEAQDARHPEGDEGGLVADGQRPKVALDAALGPNLVGAAMRAAKALSRLFDAEGGHARLEVLADVAVADDPEAVIQ